MPLLLLMAGELVFVFLGVRVAWWIWRSRGQVAVLLGSRPGPGPGLPLARPLRARPRLRALSAPELTAPRRLRRGPLRRAA